MSDLSDINIPKEEDDDKVVLIPLKDRSIAEEERVTYYMSTYKDVLRKADMQPPERNAVKFKRVVIPQFPDDRKRKIWENEEIKRCEKGYKGMSGKMYFFFNYSWMVSVRRGKFVPDYRVCHNEWFKLLTKTKDEGGWGIVCVKRRRIGASWLEACDALHDAIFNPFSIVGMNSKGKEDSRLLFVKVNFIFDNLPTFLKVKVGGKTKDQIDFYYETKDELGNKVKRGNQSYIVVKAPTVSAFEGHALNKWIVDEAGKQEDLPQMWSFTEDTMMDDTVRWGMPVLFGTSGEIGRAGAGLKEMWDNSDIYRLHKFFFVGYMGLLIDEFGNDMIEETIRWIVYERKRRKGLSTKSYYDFLQKYPLTEGEAFAQTSEGGLGNITKITAQMDALDEKPPKATKGRFKPDKNRKIKFTPHVDGEVIIYEHAKEGLADAYVAGCDPVDHDMEFPDNKLSQLSMYIIKKASGIEPPKIVAQYTFRPKMVKDYYQQAAMMLQYYNNTKVLIEKNRAGMISYFDEGGLKYLLQVAPQGIVKLVGGKSFAIGITMTKAMKDYLVELIEEYIDDHSDWIPDKELLQECLDWKTKNCDRVMGFGLSLMLLKEDKTVSRKKGASDIRLPSYGLSIGRKGTLIRTRK